MPEINGKDLLLRLRNHEHYTSTLIVLFSTSSSPWDIRFAETHQAVLITKPITYEQMDPWKTPYYIITPTMMESLWITASMSLMLDLLS